jgi:CspA family cold shock protein
LQSLLRSWRRRLLSAKDVEMVSRRGMLPGVHSFDVRLLPLPTGTVKWFNATKGYGFIQPEGGGPDAFVHISAVEAAGLSTLNEGQRVQYELVPGKSSAENLKLVS